MTGIEPLCIDQTLMTEHGRPAKESAEYRSAVEKEFVKDKPVVLRDQITKRWFQPSPTEEILCDLVVFHPRSRYQDGRPTWLRMEGLRRPYAVRTDLRPSPESTYLAQAFYAKESDVDAVPIDQMEYGPAEPIPTLWLPVGAIRIRVVEEGGQTLQEYSIDAGPSSPPDNAPAAPR